MNSVSPWQIDQIGRRIEQQIWAQRFKHFPFERPPQHCHRRHAGRATGDDVVRAVADIDGLGRVDARPSRRFQQRFRIRFVPGDVVVEHRDVEVPFQIEQPHPASSEVLHLAGDDAEAMAAGVQGGQRRVDAVEGPNQRVVVLALEVAVGRQHLVGERARVDGAVFRSQFLKRRGKRASEGRDQIAPGRQATWQVRVEGVRERLQDQVGRVDQRAVEVEKHQGCHFAGASATTPTRRARACHASTVPAATPNAASAGTISPAAVAVGDRRTPGQPRQEHPASLRDRQQQPDRRAHLAWIAVAGHRDDGRGQRPDRQSRDEHGNGQHRGGRRKCHRDDGQSRQGRRHEDDDQLGRAREEEGRAKSTQAEPAPVKADHQRSARAWEDRDREGGGPSGHHGLVTEFEAQQRNQANQRPLAQQPERAQERMAAGPLVGRLNQQRQRRDDQRSSASAQSLTATPSTPRLPPKRRGATSAPEAPKVAISESIAPRRSP